MNNDQRVSTLFSLVMILATAALGWISLKSPGLSRVVDTRSLAQVPADEQDIVARLWEDPLQAVQVEVTKPNRGKSPKHSVEAMVSAVGEKAAETTKVCLFVVPIPETPFPDDVETRLRLRYSVQMA